MRALIKLGILLLFAACSPVNESSLNGQRANSSIDAPITPKVEFEIPTSDSAAENERRVEEHIAYLARMESTPLITSSKSVAYCQGSDSAPSDNQIEDRRLGQIAMDYFENRNLTISDNLKVLVDRKGNTAIVSFEAPREEGSLGADYTARVTIDMKSGNVIQALSGT